MKKTVLALTIIAALVLSLAGCGNVPASESEAPAAEPQVTAEAQAPVEDDGQAASSETDEPQAAPSETDEPAAESVRQDGERFEAVIVIEGMEETVQYEHIRNDTLGFEMDYDYESFVRRSEADRECFVSVWDDPEHPENYLEVRSDTGNAELVASAINASLSEAYDTIVEEYELDRAGSCIRIEASELKGTGTMADLLQVVYIIPAPDGCRVATAHFSIEGAEGFGRRFSYMVKTLDVIDR